MITLLLIPILIALLVVIEILLKKKYLRIGIVCLLFICLGVVSIRCGMDIGENQTKSYYARVLHGIFYDLCSSYTQDEPQRFKQQLSYFRDNIGDTTAHGGLVGLADYVVNMEKTTKAKLELENTNFPMLKNDIIHAGTATEN
jgi:hypothetical protein